MSKKPKQAKDPLLIQIENEIKQMKRNITKPVKTERGLQKRAEQMGIKLPKYKSLTKSESPRISRNNYNKSLKKEKKICK